MLLQPKNKAESKHLLLFYDSSRRPGQFSRREQRERSLAPATSSRSLGTDSASKQ